MAKVVYAVAPSPLGQMLVAATSRGVCAVMFGEEDTELERLLEEASPGAEREETDPRLQRLVSSLQDYLAGTSTALDLPVDVHGTPFQRTVWRALQAIPRGEVRSYAEVARAIGRPGAIRAVGRACAANPVAVLVPCHRVVRSDGGLGGYGWGVHRKRVLLELEGAPLRS
ncbi:MAG: methylated-DNA--[protein]-cysteine S-methyltransferase [Armatimonadota bacterium]|nr:methylated-DNA--[protein]-cysteine S-methyltransferase [Armatimonadota bacterium]MDR7440276.1 methylated-DNA--[protein]-cysteine S-methyltransferase [Armatimonadota bacterium]MDR7563933.1 methylated-DNA--[protein]-cysteine S-methyltransferase [Armatimonadota bacterium]MDR7568177.1 methylated-DNA--[protein]-cysteine S-methyltransferase [Armatimonadota bacterium]MDR7602715.1 methylated-DNA--[protein]-cysteine S-methyltransferase [Armatimonadota bacterium]